MQFRGTGSDARRTRMFATLCGLVFAVNFGRVAFAPLLEPFMSTFGVGEATAGLVATLVWLGGALPRLPTGYLLTRVRRHRVVLATGGFLAVAAALTALSPTISAVAAGGFLVGASTGVYFIAANPLVSELFPDRVGRAVGVHGTAAQLAAVAAPLGIGALVVGGAVSWRLVFWTLAAGAALVTAALYVTTGRADMPTAGRTDRDLLGAVRAQWHIVAVGVLVLSTTGFVWNGLFNFYVSYLTATKGLTATTAGTLLTALFAAGVPAFWVTGRLADRVPHVALLLSLVAGFAVALAGLTLASGPVGLVVATLALGYLVHSLFPAMDTYMLSALPDQHRSSAYSAYSAAMMLVQSTGSVVLGTLVETGVAYDAAFRTFAAGLAVVFAGLLALHLAGRVPAGRG